MRALLAIIVVAGLTAQIASARQARVNIFVENDPVGADYRDSSHGRADGGDHLTLINGNKMPVVHDHAHRGSTSGLVEYRHAAGAWDLFIASEGWRVFDFSAMDSLVMHLNGPQAIPAAELPRIGLEDGDKRKSGLVFLGDYLGGLDADSTAWQRVAIPLSTFDPGEGFDITMFQTVRFAHGNPNAEIRTLWVDDIQAVGPGTGEPPAAPSGLYALDADRAVNLYWDPAEGDVHGYRVYRAAAGNGAWIEITTAPEFRPNYVDFEVQNGTEYRYVVTAVNESGLEGDASVEAAALPRVLTDEEFFDLVQRASFTYFWYEADPQTGQVRDRSRPNSSCSIAATGFGLTALTVGIDRGWVTREAARNRVLATLRTAWEMPQGTAPSGTIGHNGFFYHFLDCATATRAGTSELSTIDTALFLGGILHAAMYFDGPDEDDVLIRALADSIYHRVDWTWAQPRPPRITLGWHPETGFLPFDYGGYSEAMILYLLALGSPTHPVASTAWSAWTSTYQWQTHYGYSFVIFPPLFGHQYSHLWYDFRNIADAYMRNRGIDYYENSVRATLGNRAYSVHNPLGYPNYGPDEWGLTASDIPGGYRARGAPPPQNDDGTIAPTGPGGSYAFTPEESLSALRTMYDRYRTRLWGVYGFRDAYNIQEDWFASDFLGIDQGPFVIMMENHRTGSVWETFMKHEAVQQGLAAAGFQTVDVSAEFDDPAPATSFSVYPNPFSDRVILDLRMEQAGSVKWRVYDLLGREVSASAAERMAAGASRIEWDTGGLAPGAYLIHVDAGDVVIRRVIIKQ